MKISVIYRSWKLTFFSFQFLLIGIAVLFLFHTSLPHHCRGIVLTLGMIYNQLIHWINQIAYRILNQLALELSWFNQRSTLLSFVWVSITFIVDCVFIRVNSTDWYISKYVNINHNCTYVTATSIYNDIFDTSVVSN